MCRQWAGAALAAAAVAVGTLPAAAEVCSASSVPEVRYCLDDEFCCWRGCCTRSMLYFFKLSVAVVLIVMILVWLCNYLRRGRSQHECPPGGVRPRAQQQLPVFVTRAPPRSPFAAQPLAQPPAQPPAQPAPPPAQPADDLPPPYHAVVNMPPALLAPTHLPSYDASCKAMTGPA